MCTVSWTRTSDGYQLYCNRDEKLTRATALPPQVQSRDGVRYIAPRDGHRGGTWIATNQFGVSLCLLNGQSGSGMITRGRVVQDLIGAPTSQEACDRAGDVRLHLFAPFTLLALEAHQPARIAEWNGVFMNIITNADSALPLISSSFDVDNARTVRREEFARSPSLRAFHESHGLCPSAYSPCMHRADAETVSFSYVNVNDRHADFFYSGGSPCKRIPGETLRLRLQ